jgi:hypothetical protein
LTAEVYTSKLVSFEGAKELLNGDTKTVLANLNNDKAFQLVKEMADKFSKEVA